MGIMFVKVENGQIVKRLNAIPKAYTFPNGSKTGNFDIMSDKQLEEGYYPLEKNKPPYNPKIEHLVRSSINILSDKVIENYTVEAMPLETLKKKKINEIQRYSDSLLKSSLFQHNNHTFTLSKEATVYASELESLSDLTNQFPSPFTWTDTDGVEVSMTKVEFTAFVAALGAQKLTIVTASKTHVGTVQALTDPIQIVNYDYSQGWGNYIPPAEEEV